MRCIFCGELTRVTDKRESSNGTRRRRECLSCRKRFTTYEKPEIKEIIIVKKDGRKEPFSREKLKAGIMRACEKRPISAEKIDGIVGSIEERLRQKRKEIKTKILGGMIINKLKKLDKVAYIRFASVYRDFKDVKDFKKEIKGLK